MENKFINTIKKYLNHWNLQKWEYNLYYDNYKDVFGVEGIEDFIAFALYLENRKDIKPMQISGGLAHDLNGIFKKLCSPKSTGYKKALKKHYNKVI